MHPFSQYSSLPTPCYVYRKSILLQQAKQLRQLKDMDILYSVKTNPFPPILRTLAELGFGADAASAAEVTRSIEAGFPPERIYYSAPGKTKDDLLAAWGQCHLIADSLHELNLCSEIAVQRKETVSVGLRLHPPFSPDGTEAGPSKFGIEWAQFLEQKDFIRRLPGISVEGIHIHLRSQMLDAQKLAALEENILRLALRTEELLSHPLSYVNLGSGIGIPYDDTLDTTFDFAFFRKKMEELADRFHKNTKARLLMESGRFLVGECGAYLTEITDIKTSCGKTYYIVKNGANGFFRPVLSQLLGKEHAPAEPFYTHAAPSQVLLLAEREGRETVDIVGHLCTAQDVLASDVTLPKAEIGDRLLFSHAGSYGYSLSPVLFSSHPLSEQIWLEEETEV